MLRSIVFPIVIASSTIVIYHSLVAKPEFAAIRANETKFAVFDFKTYEEHVKNRLMAEILANPGKEIDVDAELEKSGQQLMEQIQALGGKVVVFNKEAIVSGEIQEIEINGK